MMTASFIDWDDAFDNSGYCPGAPALIESWSAQAAAFRAERPEHLNQPYGPKPRNRFDLFLPEAEAPKGLVIFIHGGYWHRLDNSYWSHFAGPITARGWACAIPSYTLAPEATVTDIAQEMARAVSVAAQQVDGPIRLIGHSAGGQLVARLSAAGSPLCDDLSERLERVVPVSGVHDLRPLLGTTMNETLNISADEAQRESPQLLTPQATIAYHLWVGAAERPEFLRQNRALAETWRRSATWMQNSANVQETYAPGQDHFTVIDALADAGSPLTEALLSE